MASCFKNPNKKNLSAKDYTIKKRRNTLFCNLRQDALDNIESGMVPLITIGGNEACVDKNGFFFKYRDKKSQIDMLAAFKDFRQDLLETVKGQLFKDHFCPPYYVEEKDNTNVRNGYYNNNVQLAFGEGDSYLDQNQTIEGTYGHLTNYFGALNKDIISVHPPTKNEYRNTYAEIKDIDVLSSLGGDFASGFKNNKFFLLKPNVCSDNAKPQILKAGDVPEPNANLVNILIENNGFNPPELQGINLQIN